MVIKEMDMIFECNINTNLEINNLMDLNKLKPFIENGMKVNYSRLAREFDVDRRTIKKYCLGFRKKTRRSKHSKMDAYYDIIYDLLYGYKNNDKKKVFEYKRILWQYLTDNYDMNVPQSSFRRYISSKEEFQSYFDARKKSTVKAKTPMRFETMPGKQAQLDWKENFEFVLNTGETIIINVFVFILSFSRYRIYRLSLTKTQDILFNFLTESFEAVNGVPEVLLTDNMSTVMDVARTEYFEGKVNNKFKQFADDFGFKTHPCIAGRPNTKAKVESPMRILDELKAYSGDLSYEGLVMKLEEINDRENSRYHQGYDSIPLLSLEKEKDQLLKLPTDPIRGHYKITQSSVKVNQSSMITYKRNQYSVPPEYIGKRLNLQSYDNQIHLYFNTKLVAIHDISTKRLNYLKNHYIDISRQTLSFEDETKIEDIALENLKAIGGKYGNEHST